MYSQNFLCQEYVLEHSKGHNRDKTNSIYFILCFSHLREKLADQFASLPPKKRETNVKKVSLYSIKLLYIFIAINKFSHSSMLPYKGLL